MPKRFGVLERESTNVDVATYGKFLPPHHLSVILIAFPFPFLIFNELSIIIQS